MSETPWARSSVDRVLASEASCDSSILSGLSDVCQVMTTPRANLFDSKTVNTSLICRSQKHPFHILDASPYPFLVSLFLLVLLVPTTLYLHGLDLPFGLPRADFMHIGFLGLYTTAMS